MQVFHTESKIVITCNKRLSPYLQQEVEALGFKPTRVFQTGIELQGTITDTIALNLNLRCASQVLYLLKSFKADDPAQLYNELVTIEWEKLIDFAGYFSVSSNVNNEHILTPLFANVKVKDAIADRIKSIKGIRPNSGAEANKTLIHLYWQDSDADIFIDTSGETLAKHSYRKIPGKRQCWKPWQHQPLWLPTGTGKAHSLTPCADQAHWPLKPPCWQPINARGCSG